MNGAESVGHIQLRHGGQLLGEGGVVLLLAGVKAQVLQQHDLTALQRRGLGLGFLAHDVLGEDDLLPQQLAETLRHGGQTQLGLPFALGLAQMGAGDDRRLLFQQVADGGQRRHDALVAGDSARLFVLRHIEIAAQQDLLPGHVHVQNGSSNSSDNGNNSSVQKTNTTLQNDNKTVQNDNSTVQTGVAISGGVLLVAAIALVFAVGIKKRNNIASQ